MSEVGEVSLFNNCVKVIFGSLELLRNASMLLPKHIAQYVLYEACNSSNYTAVEVIVRSWPHCDLSFDFMSNSLCRHQKVLYKSCIEAHYYCDIRSSNQYEMCVPSIVLGLFNNLYSGLKDGAIPVLQEVDLSKIRIVDYSKGSSFISLRMGYQCSQESGCVPFLTAITGISITWHSQK